MVRKCIFKEIISCWINCNIINHSNDFFTIDYVWEKLWKLVHLVASPASMIGANNIFETALVAIANRTKYCFPERS